MGEAAGAAAGDGRGFPPAQGAGLAPPLRARGPLPRASPVGPVLLPGGAVGLLAPLPLLPQRLPLTRVPAPQPCLRACVLPRLPPGLMDPNSSATLSLRPEGAAGPAPPWPRPRACSAPFCPGCRAPMGSCAGGSDVCVSTGHRLPCPQAQMPLPPPGGLPWAVAVIPTPKCIYLNPLREYIEIHEVFRKVIAPGSQMRLVRGVRARVRHC